MQTIVGLSGFARSGKDEAAAVLVNEFDFTRVAFADKLREFLYALNPLIDDTVYIKNKNGDGFHPYDIGGERIYVQEVIDQFGWDGYKETPYKDEIRRLLQRLGTEAGRQTLWDSIWIDAAFAGVTAPRIVVTDARFINEFDAVKERGGVIWRVERTGVGPINDHASEMEATTYDKFDLTVENDGTLEQYHDKVRTYANILLHGKV